MNENYLIFFNAILEKLNRATARSAITYGLVSFITQWLMMVYLIIVANWLEAGGYGFIAAAYSAALLSSFLFNWGLNEWMIKEGSINDNPEALGAKVIFFKLIIGIFWAVGLWLILRLARPELFLADILVVVILDVWFDSLFGTLLVILVLQTRVMLASIFLALSRIIRLLTGVLLIVFGMKAVFPFPLTRLLCTFLMFTIALIIARPSFKFGDGLTPWKLFLKSSPFNVGMFLNLIYMNVDVNLLSLLGADRSLVANYSVVISLLNATITLPSGVYNILLPPLTRFYHEYKERFFSYFRFIFAGFGVLGLIFFVSVILLGAPLMNLFFGEDYSDSGKFIVMLSPLFGLMTLNQANVAYLVSVGLQAKRLIPQSIVVVLKILFGIWVVSRWKAGGMTVVSTIAEFTLVGGYLFMVVKHFRQSHKLNFT